MEYVAVLLPSVAVGLIFYFVMRAIFAADRAERAAMSRAEEDERARRLKNESNEHSASGPADEQEE